MSTNHKTSPDHLKQELLRPMSYLSRLKFSRSKPMNLLLVEDDEAIANGLATALRQHSYNVEMISDGIDADETLSKKNYDLVILDLTLPRLDGNEVLRRMRARNICTPVIVLTARTTAQDRIFGLDAGADDFVTKPFDLGELEARVRAILRRNPNLISMSSTGGIELRKSENCLVLGDGSIDLSPREFAVVELLVSRLNEIVTREEIVAVLETFSADDVGDNTLEVCIHRIRKKLAQIKLPLKTLRGLGYMLLSEV